MTKITIENMEQEVEVSVHAHAKNDLDEVLTATKLLFDTLLVDKEGEPIDTSLAHGDLFS